MLLPDLHCRDTESANSRGEMMPMHNKDSRRLHGRARLSDIREPSKSRSIWINDRGRPGNEGEARTVMKDDLMTGMLSRAYIMNP